MENILLATAFIFFSLYSKDKFIHYTVAVGCAAGFVIDILIDDIAVYYALNAIVAAALAYISIINYKTKSYIFYAIIMLIQSLLCFLLIPEWKDSVNTVLEYALTTYNNGIVMALLGMGIISSDGILARICNSDNISGNSTGNRSGDDN